MSKIINGKKVGREKKVVYQSIFGDYDDRDLSKKVMTIPEIITYDIGWELATGMKRTSASFERQYLQRKHSPE
tara:strand:+ start:356 stop:574 length:219 start_codon:yes stop_codon:yes gene_type:complete